jgi:hypothetical protein
MFFVVLYRSRNTKKNLTRLSSKDKIIKKMVWGKSFGWTDFGRVKDKLCQGHRFRFRSYWFPINIRGQRCPNYSHP